MAEQQSKYSRNELISQWLCIEHGKLENYTDIGLAAMDREPQLFNHFIAYNSLNGWIRDAKIAYAALGLRKLTKTDGDLAENAIAHAMMLSPRQLIKFYNFSKALSAQGHIISGGWRRLLESALKRYVQSRESSDDRWDRAVLQHREPMKRLYRLAHCHPYSRGQEILFGVQDPLKGRRNEKGRIIPGLVAYPAGSVFEAVAMLRTAPPNVAARLILQHRIPFEVIVGAVAKITGDILLALIETMTPNQLLTNSQMLQKMGIMKDSALRGAFDAAIERAKKAKPGKIEILKAGRAAQMLDDEEMAAQLMSVQRRKVRELGGIEGDWAILADASGSMQTAIEVGRKIAALLTEKVKGKVYLIIFDIFPNVIDVTGMTYDQIEEASRRIKGGGMTAIGCGVDWLRSMGIVVNGIAIISDGGDNSAPLFHTAYQKYAGQMGIEPTVYLYHLDGQERDVLSANCRASNIQIDKFELGMSVDFYSLPQLIETMQTNRYDLIEKIMKTPLLTLGDVFGKEAA